MKLKKLTLEICGSRFSFSFIKYTEEGGAPLSTVWLKMSRMRWISLVIWCTYNNPTPLNHNFKGPTFHYPRVRVPEQHAIIHCMLLCIITINYTVHHIDMLVTAPPAMKWSNALRHVLAAGWRQGLQNQERAQVPGWAVWSPDVCFGTQFRVLNGSQYLQTWTLLTFLYGKDLRTFRFFIQLISG
jgi:hypothetical protein